MKREIQIGIGDSTKTAKDLKDFSSRKHEITKEEEEKKAILGEFDYLSSK